MAWPRTTHKAREIARLREREIDYNLLAKVENKS